MTNPNDMKHIFRLIAAMAALWLSIIVYFMNGI